MYGKYVDDLLYKIGFPWCIKKNKYYNKLK